MFKARVLQAVLKMKTYPISLTKADIQAAIDLVLLVDTMCDE